MSPHTFISSLEIGVGIGIVYLLFAIFRDMRNAFFR